MFRKNILILFFIVNMIKCNTIDNNICPHDICGNYNINTECNYLWSSSYTYCMSYLNKYNKDIINCMNLFNISIQDSWIMTNEMINGFINCNIKNEEIEKQKNNDHYILSSKCIYEKKKKMIFKNINNTCDFKIYQL